MADMKKKKPTKPPAKASMTEGGECGGIGRIDDAPLLSRTGRPPWRRVIAIKSVRKMMERRGLIGV